MGVGREGRCAYCGRRGSTLRLNAHLKGRLLKMARAIKRLNPEVKRPAGKLNVVRSGIKFHKTCVVAAKRLLELGSPAVRLLGKMDRNVRLMRKLRKGAR